MRNVDTRLRRLEVIARARPEPSALGPVAALIGLDVGELASEVARIEGIPPAAHWADPADETHAVVCREFGTSPVGVMLAMAAVEDWLVRECGWARPTRGTKWGRFAVPLAIVCILARQVVERAGCSGEEALGALYQAVKQEIGATEGAT